MRYFLFVASLALVFAGMALAREQVTTPDSSAAAVAPPDSSSMAQAETGPVAVPEMSEKAARYYRSGNVLWFVNLILGMLIPALFLFTGFSAKIRNWAQQLGCRWFFVIGLYFIIFSVINFVIDLPLSYNQGFIRQHAKAERFYARIIFKSFCRTIILPCFCEAAEKHSAKLGVFGVNRRESSSAEIHRRHRVSPGKLSEIFLSFAAHWLKVGILAS